MGNNVLVGDDASQTSFDELYRARYARITRLCRLLLQDAQEVEEGDLQVANAALTKTLFAAGEIGPADITPYAERVIQVRQQLLQEGLTVILEVRQTLTPEQRAKAARLREQLHNLQGALGALPQGQRQKTTR